MRRVLPWSIVVACLIGMAFVLSLNRRVEIQIGDAAHRETDSKEALRRADARVRELQAKLAQESQALADATKAAADTHKGPASGANSGPIRISMDDMRKDPAFAGLWKREQIRMIQRQYGDAIAAMKLSSDAESKLRNLLLERNEASADARDAAIASGLDRRDMFNAEQAAQQDVTGQIKALIGEEGYAQLNQGSQIAMQKMMVNNSLGMDLAAAGQPLTPQQEIAVTQIYASAMRTPGMNSDVDATTGFTARNQTIYNGMSSILSSQQLATAKDSLLADQQQQQFFQQQRAKQGGGEGGTTGTTIIYTKQAAPGP